ncbi:hypothetical protein ACRQHG_00610 [Actinotignum sp. GS-2025a]|uniref:hypothetical protein n=1 Tax=Actinotignum sp. GS-2025a TaxID=3427274 RepID=UPI003F472387
MKKKEDETMQNSHTTSSSISGRCRRAIGGALAGIAAATVLGLGGCSSVAVGDPDPVTPIPVALAAPSAPELSGASASGNRTMHDRAAVTDSSDASEGGRPVTVASGGDVEAQLGVPVGLSVDGATRAAFTLTVTGLTRPQQCPSRIAEPTVFTPENGTFLVADISASMAQDYAQYDPEAPFLTLDRDAFYVTDQEGNIQKGSHSVAAYGCYTTAEKVAPFINPGETAAGKVVLETSLDHGYLVYNPWGVPGSGWRWAF